MTADQSIRVTLGDLIIQVAVLSQQVAEQKQRIAELEAATETTDTKADK